MMFNAVKARVSNRGHPPDEFLNELLDWGVKEVPDVFAPNPNPSDVYAYVKPILGPWQSLLHRRAVMLEVMRVHPGLESSWNWNEGVDVTNEHSLHNLDGEETGIFQVSFDSMYGEDNPMKAYAVLNGIGTVGSFIAEMKSNHSLCMSYYARLMRYSVKWAGPFVHHTINEWLSRDAVLEFEALLG